MFCFKQQTDSQHSPGVQGPPCSSSPLAADIGPPEHILTALHTTGVWTKAETTPPPSVPGEHHTCSPLNPALMHTQRQKQERRKSKPKALAALPLNHALYKPIQPAKIPAQPHAVITQTEYASTSVMLLWLCCRLLCRDCKSH